MATKSGTAVIDMFRAALKGLLASVDWQRVIAYIVSTWFQIPLRALLDFVAEAEGLISQAAERFPGHGTGAKKWEWVWQRTQEVLADFVRDHGAQAAEFVLLWVLKTMTHNGEQT